MLDNIYGDFMSSFMLKFIGIITMLCDHTGDAFLGRFSFLNLIGRIAFPIFAFQLVQGYIHTKDIKKHIIKLFIFACISQVPFMLFLSTFSNNYYLNIFFTLLLGTVAMLAFDKINNKFLSFLIVLFMCLIAEVVHVDYGAFGVALVFVFYLFKDNKLLTSISFFLLTFIEYLPNAIKYPSVFTIYLQFILWTFLAIVPILLYNGKQGPKVKYLFYIFYPLHLTILWALCTFVF